MIKKLLSLLVLIFFVFIQNIRAETLHSSPYTEEQSPTKLSYYNAVFKEKTVTYTGFPIYHEPENVSANVIVKYDRNGLIDAGSYMIKAYFYSQNNVLLGTKSARLNIKKARITGVTLKKKEVTYDGTLHKLELVGELPAGVTAVYKNNAHTNAGVYKMNVRLTGKNYITSSRNNELTILPLDISKTIHLQSQVFIYDAKPKSLFIETPLPKGLNISYKGNNQSEVGTHTVTATITGSKNYTPIPYEMKASLTISEDSTIPKIPSLDKVVFDNLTSPYTSHPIPIIATNLPDDVSVQYSRNDFTTVGSYEIKASFYFKNILIGTKVASLTIEKARITGVTFNKTIITYNGERHTLLLKGELPEGVIAEYNNNTHINAGEYKATVKLTGDNYITSTRSNILIIAPIDLTKMIEFKSQSFVYDGIVRSLFINTPLPRELKVAYKNNYQNSVGNHIIQATISGSNNYTPMPYTMTATLAITEKEEILPKIDKIVFENSTVPYTGEIIPFEATYIPEGVTVKYNRTNLKNIGKYQVTASFYYKDILLGTKSATLTIEKARITTVKFSKKEVTYDGNTHELLLEGELPEGVTAVYKNNIHTNAGEHKVTVTLTGDNYVTSTRSNLLVILPADITKLVSLESNSFEYDGQPKSLTIKGDVPKGITLKYENSTHSEVGNYTVKAILDGSANYTPRTYVITATLSINEKPVVLPSIENVVFAHKTEVYTAEVIAIE
ncbi:MAG: MBG domain-containing protein, partial [Flavobacterium sp.]